MRADTVVEVVVRIAGELHDVAYLRDGTYRAGVREIAIAEVRQELADRTAPIVIEQGLVTITLQLCDASHTPVPLKRIERRPLVYGTGSLVAHLALVIAALHLGAEVALPSVASQSKGRRARISSSFAAEAQTVKRAAVPEPVETPVTVDTTPAPVPSADPDETGGAEDQIGLPPEPLDSGGDLVVDPPGSEGGRSRKFDPDTSAEFDTVKVGGFSTVSHGRLSGAEYGTQGKRNGLIVVSCDAATCIVLGGENAAPIRKAVEENLAEITACYANEERAAGKKIEIDLGIDDAGKVGAVEVGGIGDVGNCVADIIKRTAFHQDA